VGVNRTAALIVVQCILETSTYGTTNVSNVRVALAGPRLRTSEQEVDSMHSLVCLFGLIFLVILALIAIPILIIVAKLMGVVIIGGLIALIGLGVLKLFDLAEPRYRPY
jgi:hypothetical protein